MLEKIAKSLNQLRKTKPVILNLTNYVTMDFMANSLLALGAAPLMSHDAEEIPELLKISHAINLNIGTFDKTFIQRCQSTIALSKTLEKPFILDPVGAGASLLRTRHAKDFMQNAAIIRGNASEILALAAETNSSKTLGVEALHSVHDVKIHAKNLAKELNNTIVVSGKEDFITQATREKSLYFGSALMTLVTGMGCTLSAVIAAFKAVITDSFEAAEMATAYFSLCGNLAAKKTKHPGSFRIIFIDELYAANFVAMEEFLYCENEYEV